MKFVLAAVLLALFVLPSRAQDLIGDRVSRLELDVAQIKKDNALLLAELKAVLLALNNQARPPVVRPEAVAPPIGYPQSCGPQGCAPGQAPGGYYSDHGSVEAERRQPVRRIIQRLRHRRGGC